MPVVKKTTRKVCAGTRKQASSQQKPTEQTTSSVDLLRSAPSVPRSVSADTKQRAAYTAGFEASYNLYKPTDLAALRVKAAAYDRAKKLILEQERATQRVGVLEKQILGLFRVSAEDNDDGAEPMSKARTQR